MDKKCTYDDLDVDNDIEIDCAPIEHVQPIPERDITKELCPVKDIRFSSLESGYGDSVKSSLNSVTDNLSSDLEKLKLASIEEQLTVSEDDSNLYDSIEDAKYRNNNEQVENERAEHEELLLEIFRPDKDGDSQLHMAIIQMLSPITLYFINLVPSHHWLNLPNNLLQVPLHLATITRQALIVRKLMAAGADIVPRDYKGDTPLHIASREGFDDIVQILLTPIEDNETSDVRYHLYPQRIPQDTQLMNYNGQSCLHLAAERCHLHILRLLLKTGANINITDGKCGKTILHYAAETRNTVLLEFLITQPGIDLNATTYGGLTAAQLADGRGFRDVIGLLRKHGAVYIPLPLEENESDEDMNE